MFHRNSRVRTAEITDGTSNTVGIGERDDHFVTTNWVGVIPGAEAIYNPQRGLGCKNWRPPLTAVLAHSRQTGANDPSASPGGFQSQHPGGGNFLFMDGSVRYLKASHQPPHHVGPLHAQQRRGDLGRLLLKRMVQRHPFTLKSSALHEWAGCGQEIFDVRPMRRNSSFCKYARQDLNLQPLAPEAWYGERRSLREFTCSLELTAISTALQLLASSTKKQQGNVVLGALI